MDYTQLKYFQILARAENMSRTAALLHVAQPAISASLARLEKELDVKLFDRNGKKLHLNRAGQLFLDFTDRTINDMENTMKLLKKEQLLDENDITVASTSFITTQQMFFSYMAENPEMKLKQYSLSGNDIADEIKKERCDFVISTIPVTDSSLQSTLLMTQQIGLIVPATHPFAGREWIDLIEAEQENFVCMQQGTAFRQMTDDLCQKAGFKPHVVMEYFPSQLIESVEHSNGVALGINYKEREIYFKTTLCYIPIRNPVCRRDVELLWKKERQNERKIQSFIRYVRNYYLNQNE